MRNESDSRNAIRGLALLWILMVIVVHLILITVSAFRPLTSLERNTPVWPPSQPLWHWLERVWCAPLDRWDVRYYVRVASTGYGRDDGTAQFHPMYPLLASFLVRLGIGALPALVVVGFTASLLFICAFYCAARSDLAPQQAQFAVLSLVLGPFGVALALPYPEGLFLALSVATLTAADGGKWLLAGFCGALATLTRQQGVFLIVPLAYLAWESRRPLSWQRARLASQVSPLLAVALVPIAYAGFVSYRTWFLRDTVVGWGSLHDLVYSLLISPSAAQVVPTQSFVWPWVAVRHAVEKVLIVPDLDIVVNLVGAAWFLVLLVLSWRAQSVSHRLYTLLIVISSFAYHTGPVHPYMGLLRHLSLAFPVFLGFALRTKSGLARACYLSVSIVGQAFLLLLYGLESWVI